MCASAYALLIHIQSYTCSFPFPGQTGYIPALIGLKKTPSSTGHLSIKGMSKQHSLCSHTSSSVRLYFELNPY